MRNKQASAAHAVLTVLLLLFLYVVQVSLLLRFSPEVLDLLPPFAVAAGSVLGPGAGMACGLLAGALYDVSGSGIEGLYPLYFMLWGIVSGCLNERHPRARLRVSMVCTAVMVGVIPALRYLFYYQFVADEMLSAFTTNAVTRIIAAVVLCPVFIDVLRLMGRLCRWRPVRRPRRALDSLPESAIPVIDERADDSTAGAPDAEPEEAVSDPVIAEGTETTETQPPSEAAEPPD